MNIAFNNSCANIIYWMDAYTKAYYQPKFYPPIDIFSSFILDAVTALCLSLGD